MTGIDAGSGSRPTFLYDFGSHAGDPRISYAFHERVIERAWEAKV